MLTSSVCSNFTVTSLSSCSPSLIGVWNRVFFTASTVNSLPFRFSATLRASGSLLLVTVTVCVHVLPWRTCVASELTLIFLRSSFLQFCLLLLFCEMFVVVVVVVTVSALVPLSKLSFLLKRLCSRSSKRQIKSQTLVR